jgi:hypothetical protein
MFAELPSATFAGAVLAQAATAMAPDEPKQ